MADLCGLCGRTVWRNSASVTELCGGSYYRRVCGVRGSQPASNLLLSRMPFSFFLCFLFLFSPFFFIPSFLRRHPAALPVLSSLFWLTLDFVFVFVLTSCLSLPCHFVCLCLNIAFVIVIVIVIAQLKVISVVPQQV